MLIHLPNNYENAKVEVIVLLVNSEEGSEDVPELTIALDESPPIEYIDEIDQETQIVDNHFPKAMEESLLPVFKNKIALKASLLKEGDAAVLGASALAWQELAKK